MASPFLNDIPSRHCAANGADDVGSQSCPIRDGFFEKKPRAQRPKYMNGNTLHHDRSSYTVGFQVTDD